jgi:N-acetyltransferase
MIATPALDGVRVRLEPMTEAHLAGLEEIAYTERIWRYMLTRVKTRDDLRGWMEAALRDKETGTSLPWVTVLKGEGRIIGSTRFIDLDLRHRTTELGHTWLSPSYHGGALNA